MQRVKKHWMQLEILMVAMDTATVLPKVFYRSIDWFIRVNVLFAFRNGSKEMDGKRSTMINDKEQVH